MDLREWFADNIGYRFLGCCYNNKFNRGQIALFDFIESKVPSNFLGKEICDLGCGDGSNTTRLRKIFKPKSITGYERNEYLIKRAMEKGIVIRKIDLNQEMPRGEMATFTFSLHHLKDKEKALKLATENFKYLFLCEPVKDLYHALFDGGRTLSKNEWLSLFSKILKRYKLYQHKSSLIVFYNSFG